MLTIQFGIEASSMESFTSWQGMIFSATWRRCSLYGHQKGVVLLLGSPHMCHGQNMVSPWAQASPQRGRWRGPLLIGSCSLLKALLVKCFGMRFFRQVYASVTTKIPAFCPACWCRRWFLPSYFCLVVLTLIMFWCARSSRTWALSNIDVRMTSLFF